MIKTLNKQWKSEFEKNKYVKISQAVDSSVINFIDNYITLFYDRYVKIGEHIPQYYNVYDHGEVLDETVDVGAGSFSHHGDLISETLLSSMRESVGLGLGLELVPTYGYFRIYTKGNELKKHSDSPSCEISMTICIGYEGKPWPIFIEGTPVYQEPGDLVIYRGCDVEHWREELKGKRQTQMFLHYNDRNGPNGEDNLYDGRPFLGVPSWTKNPSDRRLMDPKLAEEAADLNRYAFMVTQNEN